MIQKKSKRQERKKNQESNRTHELAVSKIPKRPVRVEERESTGSKGILMDILFLIKDKSIYW